MKNENGFGLIGFLALLPLVVSLLATIAGSAMLFKADAHLKHECRTSVLNSQRKVAGKLRDLMKLNPQARTLRADHERAKKALKAAMESGQPEAIAAAEAYLAYVQAKRVRLMTRQQSLLLSARALTTAAPLRARDAVMTAIGKEAAFNDVRRPRTRASSRPGSFDVVATPEGDLTPDYDPSSRFTSNQTVDVDVRVDLGPLLPDWLREILPNRGLEITSHCQATIEEQEEKWVETLNAVK